MRPLQVYRLAAGVIFLATVVAGCNERSFVDPLPPEADLTLPAEGGRLSLSTGLGGANALSVTDLNLPGGAPLPTKIYHLNIAGDTLGSLADAAIGELPATMIIDRPTLNLRITAQKDGHVSVISGLNLSRTDSRLSVNIHYSGGATYSLPLVINGIEPLRGVEITYPYSIALREDEDEEQLMPMRYTNLTDDTATIVINPYRQARIGVKFDADNPFLPVDEGDLLPLPSPGSEAAGFAPGFYGLEAPYSPGRELTYQMPEAEASLAVSVKLPPLTSRSYYIFLRRRSVSAYYRVKLVTPSLDEPVITGGMVEVSKPIGFIIGYVSNPLEDNPLP